MSIKQLCELHPHLQEYHKICSLQLLCHLSHQHFLSLPTQNTENVLQAEGRCNYPLPVKISFKVQNFHFQLSLFVDSIFYILVAKMVRYSQDIIIELQSGLEAWPERFSRPDCPHGTLCAWLTHAHDVLCAWHTHAHVRVAVSRARILYTKTPPGAIWSRLDGSQQETDCSIRNFGPCSTNSSKKNSTAPLISPARRLPK